MKKLFSYTLVILIITLSLNISGCSVKNNENNRHLRFYCLKDGATTHIGGYDPLKDIIRKYNAKCDQNGLVEDKIELVEFDSERQLSEKMSTEIMAGTGPDILTSRFSLPFEKLRGSGALADIYELSKSSDIGLNNCNSNILKYGISNGKLYVIPLYYSPDVFVTTEETLAKYGLTSKSFSFVDLAKTLKNNHMTYSLLGAKDLNTNLFYSFLSCYVDFESGTTAFDSDEFHDTLDYLVELILNDETDPNTYYFLQENIKSGKSILYKEFPSVYQVFRTYCLLSYLEATPALVYNYNRTNHTCPASVDVSVGINNNSRHTVTPVLTNENYFSVMSIPITGSLKENTKAAAISSDLALKLYFNTDVIGKTMVIGNSEYTISGVYEKQKGIVNELSSDDKERVYLHYSDYSSYKTQEVQSICYRNDDPSAPLIEQMDFSQYHLENIGEKAKILNNFKSLFFLMIFISLSVIALRIWYKLCGRFFSEMKSNLSENYFFKSVRSIPLKYLLLVVTAAGIPLLIIIVFQFINFSIFIPSKYIPYDNIFDVPYYFSKIIEQTNIIHSLSLTGNTYCFDLYHNSFNMLSALMTAFVMIYSVLFVIINAL